ncbi:hypothetical protein GCM10020255_017660 [Rhodococcus baikonurensis]
MRSTHNSDRERLPIVTLKPFEDVVTEYGAVVLRVCRAVVGPVDAEDAWSETFIAAMRAYPDLNPDANVEAWLVTIAHRKAIDITRVRARVAVPTDDVPELPTRIGVPGTWDHELWDALEQLPLKQRGSCLSLSGWAAVRRDRGHPRQYAGSSQTGGRRRNRHLTKNLSVRHRCGRESLMNTDAEVFEALPAVDAALWPAFARAWPRRPPPPS